MANVILNINEVKPIIELSNDQLIQKVRSVGTMSPKHGLSEKYSFIPTIKAVNLLRDDGWLPTEVRECGIRAVEKMGFQKHMIRFSKPDLSFQDKRMEMVMYNSHDGGSSFQLYGGIYRLVCSNGLVVGQNEMGFRHRHVGFSPELFLDSAKFISQNLVKIAEKTQEWSKIELEEPEKQDFAWAVHQYLYGENSAPIFSNQLLNVRRKWDEGNDLWSVFNVVQENVTKGGLNGFRKDGARMKTRQIIDLNRDREVNQNLWNMAEALAEWKNAA